MIWSQTAVIIKKIGLKPVEKGIITADFYKTEDMVAVKCPS
jgi:hypothetical protein